MVADNSKVIRELAEADARTSKMEASLKEMGRARDTSGNRLVAERVPGSWATLRGNARALAQRWQRRMRVVPPRPIGRWAEEEIVVPSGPFAGEPFSTDTQPFARCWFDAVAADRHQVYVATGPVQSGKTLIAVVIVTLYVLFELCETVVFGVPDKPTIESKWRRDLKPAIEASAYANLLPVRGPGSKGGQAGEVEFGNGAFLRFMTGGQAREAGRAGYATRVLVLSEIDKFRSARPETGESDAVDALVGRTAAWGSDRRIYAECTPTTEAGRVWRLLGDGTNGAVYLRCPHCRDYVTPPDREHLVGWQDVPDKPAASERAGFCCPSCGALWTEAERRAANGRCVLVAEGQQVTKRRNGRPKVGGDAKRSDTFSMRWSAVHNLVPQGMVGVIAGMEWAAAQEPDNDELHRPLCNYYWALPYAPPGAALAPIDPVKLARRTAPLPRGRIPAAATWLTVGLDLGSVRCHWAAIAWGPNADGWVVDYGYLRLEAAHQIGVERALVDALREFRDVCAVGWLQEDGATRPPDQVWIDSRWKPEVVLAFCGESGEVEGLPPANHRYRPVRGVGPGQDAGTRYTAPKRLTKEVVRRGDGYHVAYEPAVQSYVATIDVNAWKSWVHQRWTTKPGAAGALSLFAAPVREHMDYCRHMAAEQEVEEFSERLGLHRVWKRRSKANHWFDGTVYAAAAGHFCGARLVTQEAEGGTKGTEPDARAAGQPKSGGGRLTTPDGRPYFVMERS